MNKGVGRGRAGLCRGGRVESSRHPKRERLPSRDSVEAERKREEGWQFALDLFRNFSVILRAGVSPETKCRYYWNGGKALNCSRFGFPARPDPAAFPLSGLFSCQPRNFCPRGTPRADPEEKLFAIRREGKVPLIREIQNFEDYPPLVFHYKGQVRVYSVRGFLRSPGSSRIVR